MYVTTPSYAPFLMVVHNLYSVLYNILMIIIVSLSANTLYLYMHMHTCCLYICVLSLSMYFLTVSYM